MGKGTGIQPSERNIYNFVIPEGVEFDTTNAPFELFTFNAITGDKTPFDIEALNFEGSIELSGTEVFSISNTMFTKEVNKLTLLTTGLNLRKGVYTYFIRFEGGYHIIKGELKIS